MNQRLNSSWWALRIGLGVAPFLAGLDKFFNLLTNWKLYLNPLALRLIPVHPETFLHAIGVVEMIVGLAILTRWTRLGAYAASLWLVGIALNLVTMGAFFDVAVRDILLALAAFTLARLTEVRQETTANSLSHKQGLVQASAAWEETSRAGTIIQAHEIGRGCRRHDCIPLHPGHLGRPSLQV